MAEVSAKIVLKDPKNQELSDDDKQLKEELHLLLQHLLSANKAMYKPALEMIANHIRASTTSMTSVPKPLKFLRPYYKNFKIIYKNMPDQETKNLCAAIISVLSTVTGDGNCLTYRLLQEPAQGIGNWGHEYVRHLSAEIIARYHTTSGKTRTQLIELVKQITIYNIENNAEIDACDLLMEIEQLQMLLQYVDSAAYPRVSLYLMTCYSYVPSPENTVILETALQLSRKFHQHTQSMRLALLLNNMTYVSEIFNEPKDLATQKQLAFLLARHQVPLQLDESNPAYDDLMEIISNTNLNKYFLNFARELDIMEPKVAEDIYKSYLDNIRQRNKIDSARHNLAISFVNGFINAAFGIDKLLSDDGNKWLYKNNNHGMLSATASIGLIKLWDIEGGLGLLDQYLYSKEAYIKAGALLGCGILNCGIRSEIEPAHALLSDYINNQNSVMRIASILGLGIAYAGSNRSIVIDTLTQIFANKNEDIKILCITALSLGLISVGSCHANITKVLLQTINNLTYSSLENIYIRFLWLGLGLLYLGRQTNGSTVMPTLEKLTEPHRSIATTMLEICSYAGTGDVLKIQKLQHMCSDHYDTDTIKEKNKEEVKEKDLSAAQAVAILGIALIAMGEDIGAEMAVRSFGNHLQYCEPCIRRAVPLALGLLCASNPKMNIMEILSKLSHDSDNEVAHNAIFAMGIVGAGTINARLASMLRQLAQYHAKNPANLFIVRIAQGLTHLGKGTLTINPYHSDRQLMNPTTVAALMTVLVTMLDAQNLLSGQSHYLLYAIVPAIQPRVLITFDENLNELNVPVRVGAALDVIGQAGKPKTITGFQTQTTPVLLAVEERAELATEEYIPATPIIEGFVILNKNSNYVK